MRSVVIPARSGRGVGATECNCAPWAYLRDGSSVGEMERFAHSGGDGASGPHLARFGERTSCRGKTNFRLDREFRGRNERVRRGWCGWDHFGRYVVVGEDAK